jgi:hypothetical protein
MLLTDGRTDGAPKSVKCSKLLVMLNADADTRQGMAWHRIYSERTWHDMNAARVQRR